MVLIADRGSIDGHASSWGPELTAKVRNCPREKDHAYGPSGYLAWHEWALRRQRTHDALLCDCGLYLLLVRKVVSTVPADELGVGQ